jgi:hypothetical protein
MNRTIRGLVSAVMCLLLVGSAAGSSAMASDQRGTIGPAELDAALALHERKEAGQRERVRALLQRDDVRAVAAGQGIDLRRAEGALDTLGGEDLRRLADQTAAVEAGLAGGDLTITISLIALLLIIIIVILLAD